MKISKILKENNKTIQMLMKTKYLMPQTAAVSCVSQPVLGAMSGTTITGGTEMPEDEVPD
jgi:hypothetical protein